MLEGPSLYNQGGPEEVELGNLIYQRNFVNKPKKESLVSTET